jgi:hypothetical protein
MKLNQNLSNLLLTAGRIDFKPLVMGTLDVQRLNRVIEASELVCARDGCGSNGMIEKIQA